MQSFGISLHAARIIGARSYSVSRADCMVVILAGGRDPAKTVPCSPAVPSRKR